jgi:hypothetical protein
MIISIASMIEILSTVKSPKDGPVLDAMNLAIHEFIAKRKENLIEEHVIYFIITCASAYLEEHEEGSFVVTSKAEERESLLSLVMEFNKKYHLDAFEEIGEDINDLLKGMQDALEKKESDCECGDVALFKMHFTVMDLCSNRLRLGEHEGFRAIMDEMLEASTPLKLFTSDNPKFHLAMSIYNMMNEMGMPAMNFKKFLLSMEGGECS